MTLRLGLRNLRRRPGRTALTLAMLATGAWLIVITVGLSEGPYADMIRMATGTWTGHFQIQHPDYHDSPALYETVEAPEALMDRLARSPEVEAVTARVEMAGLLSAGNRTAAAMLTGVIPEREPHVSSLSRTIAQGTFLTLPDARDEADGPALPIVLGEGLAQRLKVELGSEIVYMGQAADGSIAAEAFVLTGIMRSGISELDASLALIRLEDAQPLMELPGRVHMIVGRVRALDEVSRLAQAIAPALPEASRFYTWSELMPEVESSIESDRKGSSITLVIIILMVALGAINTMMMAVFERTREFGVMKALGTSPAQIVAVILSESFWLSFGGVLFGTLLATAMLAYWHQTGLTFFEEPVEFGGLELSVLYPANSLKGNVIYPAVILFASLFGALIPAWRAARLDPVEAIRGE